MSKFVPTEFALLPLPSPEEAQRIIKKDGGKEALAEYLQAREEQIRLATDENNGNPLHYGFDLGEPWEDAIKLLGSGLPKYGLSEKDFLYVAGGKRASKSEWASKWVVRAALAYSKGVIWCFQDSEATSIGTQQKNIWKHLPPEIKALRGKRNPVFKVNYSQANGFADRKLILPNGTEIWFLTYNQSTEDYQGWKIGAPVQDHEIKKWIEVRDRKKDGDRIRFEDAIVPLDHPDYKGVGTVIPNIGAWADENLSIEWWETCKFRRGDYLSKVVWTFSPLMGITDTVKEFKGSPALVQHRPAELLPDHKLQNSKCPRGSMPYIEQPIQDERGVIYFFSKWNPLANCYESVKQSCAGKASDYVERNAYGYARDSRGRCFPLFGEYNIIKPEHLPDHGENYCLCDPAGERNWCFLWVRVLGGLRPVYYVYREWPDAQTYGEWAMPAQKQPKGENARQWDGVPGPAQVSVGYGIVEYKRLLMKLEEIRTMEGERDPYRKRLMQDMMKNPGRFREIREEITDRIMDSRAASSEHAAEKGASCITFDMAKEHRKEEFGYDLPPIYWFPAPGVQEQDGISAINDLLLYNNEQEIVAGLNEPRLFISERCLNLIWAINHYTGRGGQKGACKDWIDLLRYMALGNLGYTRDQLTAVRRRNAGY